MSKPLVIGTSGSPHYLNDTTGSRRFWPVRAEGAEEAVCDGLHDEDAPSQYLCSRCFPDPLARDLTELDDDYQPAIAEEID